MCDQVWESSAQLHRGQPEPKAQEQSFSEGISCGLCTVPFKCRNHRTRREPVLFSLDVRIAHTGPYNTGADRSVSSHLIITVTCPRVYDTLGFDDVLSSVCLYAFIIVSIWLQISISGKTLTRVKHFRCLDHKNISSPWIPFGFIVTGNIMFLKELTHTEIIWIAWILLQILCFILVQESNTEIFYVLPGFTLSFKQNIPTVLLANESGMLWYD